MKINSIVCSWEKVPKLDTVCYKKSIKFFTTAKQVLVLFKSYHTTRKATQANGHRILFYFLLFPLSNKSSFLWQWDIFEVFCCAFLLLDLRNSLSSKRELSIDSAFAIKVQNILSWNKDRVDFSTTTSIYVLFWNITHDCKYLEWRKVWGNL